MNATLTNMLEKRGQSSQESEWIHDTAAAGKAYAFFLVLVVHWLVIDHGSWNVLIVVTASVCWLCWLASKSEVKRARARIYWKYGCPCFVECISLMGLMLEMRGVCSIIRFGQPKNKVIEDLTSI